MWAKSSTQLNVCSSTGQGFVNTLGVPRHGSQSCLPGPNLVWDSVKKHLSRKDTVTLALPGFNTTVREGFAATKEAYAAWIVSELERTETRLT